MLDTYETFVNWVTDIDFWYDIGIALAIFLGFVIFRKLFAKYILKIIMKFTSKSRAQVFHKIVLAFESPLQAFFILLGFYLAYTSLEFSVDHIEIPKRLFRTGIILLVTWGLFNLSSSTSVLFEQIHRRLNVHVDQILIPFLSRVLKFIILAISISVIAQEWGYNVNGFVAGLGIGGLAIAFAAKESLSNLLGGVVIIIERPFSIGDWIQTPSVEGVVEDINFRSTQVRTFADSLVTVPNATISNEAITNWSRMRKRQIFFNLRLTYSTPREKVKVCVDRIRTMIREHEGVHPEYIVVNFDTLNTSSLDLILYFFTITTSWDKYLAIKEDINLKILEILEEENVDVAFPSTSVYMETQHDTNEEVYVEKHREHLKEEHYSDDYQDKPEDDGPGQVEGERG